MKLEQLRAQILKIEHRPAVFQPVVGEDNSRWQLGCEVIDKVLPEGQLAQNALHDFSCSQPRNTPGMDRFVLALLQRLPATEPQKPIIWCQSKYNIRENGHPYGPGLKAIGIAPERLVNVSLRKERDLAFAMEESLRSRAVAVVIGEGVPVGFTASRRLSLACQEMATPCLFLNTTATNEASAAATRWRIAPAIGPPDERDPHGPGLAAWSVVLARARGGRAHPDSIPWTILWNNETHSFNLVSPPGNRALADSQKPRPTLYGFGAAPQSARKVS
ncbi:MAG: hypothetical protein GY945_15385 [Rhodobacteraceae bacterium]|nr:hypothetical protein [Paracoccaceae bacterium]